MESGVRNSVPKTPSPRRVTSRSSCNARSRPDFKRAIFNRTEFEPISTAAKVGMAKPHSLHADSKWRHRSLRTRRAADNEYRGPAHHARKRYCLLTQL